MTRPLRYEDSFTSIINEKIHDKFLNIFNIKVQSTAFCQKLNLQRSLMVSSLYDILFGVGISIYYFRTISKFSDSYIIFLENFILMSGIAFGFVGLDSAANLRKFNAKIYKMWRILITFLLPIIEILNNFSFFCNMAYSCNKIFNFAITIILFIINIYLTRISWSFHIRLLRNHELLIIHGKYLEKMISEESYKISDIRKYVPPELSLKNSSLPILNEVNEMQNFKSTPKNYNKL